MLTPEVGASTAYRRAGVDIKAADRALNSLKSAIRSTHRPEVMPDLGQFAGLFRLAKGRMREPVLVSSTDGVGTKLKLAQMAGQHQGIGVDVVAMNTNDVLAYGAEPLFFLDYIAVGKIDRRVYRQLLRGVAQGCKLSGCALLGGETAEMPGVYDAGEYDIAGFCVGVVDRRKIIDGSAVRAGDAIIGLASSGVHANGFSLVRQALGESALLKWKRELLVPTRIYVKPVLELVRRGLVSAIAHVTGGGLVRRVPSLVARQPGLQASWTPGAWPIPAIFQRIEEAGGLSRADLYGTFNMGIGMVVACRPAQAASVMRVLQRFRFRAWPIGAIERRRHASSITHKGARG